MDTKETIKYSTVDKETWFHAVKQKEPASSRHGSFYDFEGVNYLQPIIESYMLSPVAIYDSKPITAHRSRVINISDFLEVLKENNERIVLHELIYCPSFPIYSELDVNTFDLKLLDKPKVNEGYWMIRFFNIADINKDTP